MQKKKAIMIGAGLSNMAAAVYLIQEGKWSGDQITFYALDNYGSNDGSPTQDVKDDYWNKNHPMEIKRVILLAVVVCLTTVPMLT